MNKLKQLPLLGALAIFSAGSLAAYSDDNVVVKEFKIEVEADSEKGAHVIVDGDVDHAVVKLSKEDLNDPAKVEAALADLPEETREKVSKALSNIQMDGDKFFFTIDDDSENQWISKSGEEHMIIVDVDSEESADGSVIKKVIKKMAHGAHGHDGEKVFKFKHSGKSSTDILLHLIKKGDFSAEDLDKLQQALDEKR